MQPLERIVKIVITLAVFIVAQTLLAASVTTLFELIPIRIERLFANEMGQFTGKKLTVA